MPPTKPSPSADESLKWVVPFYFTSGAVISRTPPNKGQHSFPIAGRLLKGVPRSARPNLPCHDAFVYCFRWAPISPHSLSEKCSGKEFPGQGAKLYRARAGKIAQGRRSTQNLSLLAPGPAGSRLQVAGRLQGSSPRGSSKKPLPRKSSKKPSSRKASLRQGVVEEAEEVGKLGSQKAPLVTQRAAQESQLCRGKYQPVQ